MGKTKWFLLFIVHFFLSWPFLNLWFTGDDFVALSTIFSYNPIKILFFRDAYILFNPYFFTPLLPISFLDGYLFKLDPMGYHLHNYLALFLTALIIYKVARIYLPPKYAFLSAVFFLFSIPVFFNIGSLPHRHYNWGCFLVFLGFYLFKDFEKTGAKSILILSVLAYFCALLFKCVFAPFPLVILLLSECNFHKRMGIFMIYISVFFIYLIWRFYMLGGLGGYMFFPYPSVFQAISALFFHIPYETSKRIWLMPFFIYLVPIALFIIRPKIGAIFVSLIFMSEIPFIFAPIWPAYGLTGKFLTLLGIISIALCFLIYYVEKSFSHFSYYLVCGLILILQVVQLPQAFKEINATSSLVKNTCYRLSKGDIKVVYSHISWVYNYFFLVQHLMQKQMPHLIGIGALDRNNLPLDLYIYERYIDSFSPNDQILISSENKQLRYNDVKETIVMMRQRELLPKPNIKLNYKSHLLKVKIADKRAEGHFRLYFFATLNKGNNLFWSIPIRKKHFSCPIKKGERIVFIFVSADGKFSEPLIFKEPSN